MLVKSFSTQIKGFLLKKMMLYASLLFPPNRAFWLEVAWRASQKL